METENNKTNTNAGNPTQENTKVSGIKVLQEQLVNETQVIDDMISTYVKGTFWVIEPSGKLEICHSWLIEYLAKEGFFMLDHGAKLTLVWESSHNIIVPTNIKIIKNHVLNFIDGIEAVDIGNGATKDHLKQKLVKGVMNYINAPKLELLPIKQIEFLKDTFDTSYVFFKNCAAKVTVDKIEAVSYCDLPARVWGGKVKPYDFNPDSKYGTGSVIGKFFRKICTSTTEKLTQNEQDYWCESLRSHVGYLLHRYKPGQLSVMIAFLDRHIRNYWEANGGVGKSIIMKCVRLLRDVERFDGKSDISYMFSFDTVNTWTDIIFIEDLKKEISIERFFVGITEAVSIKKKYQQQLVLTDDERPKYVVTSNYVLRMPVGASSERRLREIEIGDCYSDKFTPFDDFKHEFFREWDNEEYQRFFHFMLSCLQLYISKSIIPAPNINKEYRRLLSHTSDDFIEFMDDYLSAKSGTLKIRKVEIRELYRKMNPSQKNIPASQNKFTSMMKKYFDYKSIRYSETPLRTKQYFEIQLPTLSPESGSGSISKSEDNGNNVMSAEQAERMFESLNDGKFNYNTIDTNE